MCVLLAILYVQIDGQFLDGIVLMVLEYTHTREYFLLSQTLEFENILVKLS